MRVKHSERPSRERCQLGGAAHFVMAGLPTRCVHLSLHVVTHCFAEMWLPVILARWGYKEYYNRKVRCCSVVNPVCQL